MIHGLKTEKKYFDAVISGRKNFEVRKNDRPFEQDDFLALNEWEDNKYTGRSALVKITYIMSDIEFCKGGYVIMGIEPCRIRALSDQEIVGPAGYGRITVPVYGKAEG